MLTGLFFDYMTISLATSLIIIGFIALSPVMRKRYTAKWLYWIWMILLIRLLLPYHFSFTNKLVEIHVPGSPKIDAVFQNIPLPSKQTDPSAIMHPALQAVESTQTTMLISILALIWLFGLISYLIYHFGCYYTFRKQALRWSRPIGRESTTHQINRIFKEMNVHSVTILTSEKVPNPMLMGFIKLLLLLPHVHYTEEELEFILRHELVHYKRHDILYKLGLLVVQAIHWFNPIVWLMARAVRREIENYCDETVVRTHSFAYRKKYCAAILSAMEKGHFRYPALSMNFSDGKHAMKQRFQHILDMRKKRNGFALCCIVVLLLGAIALLTACTNLNIQNNSASLKPGTIYAYNSSGERMVVQDAGNSYSLDAAGHVSVSYQNGKIKAEVPLKLDITGTSLGMGAAETGFFIAEEKTAIVYGFADGKTSPLHVLISHDMGQTWNDYEIKGAKGYDTKFIGFSTKDDGWIVAGGSAGVGHSLNYVYQTSDGGKTWQELGNPNELYAEQLTGAGFSNQDIGFLGFRYYADNGPTIYMTQDKGVSWVKLTAQLPEKFGHYQKTPLSPIFNGKEGRFPLLLSKEGNIIGTIYLSSKDEGHSWAYDERYDQLDGDLASSPTR